jgi:hypothetical protein
MYARQCLITPWVFASKLPSWFFYLSLHPILWIWALSFRLCRRFGPYSGFCLETFTKGCLLHLQKTTQEKLWEPLGVFGTMNDSQFLWESVESEPNNTLAKHFCSKEFKRIQTLLLRTWINENMVSQWF